MEASDTAAQPPQEPGQTDAVGGAEQDQSQPEQPAQSQEQPTEDSNLTTPQADQPVPSEPERTGEDVPTPPPADAAVQQDESAGEAPPKPRFEQPEPSAPVTSGAPQSAAQQESDLNAQRQEHAARTGGGTVNDGELQQARQDHNDRTGGGQVPGVEPQASQPAEGSG